MSKHTPGPWTEESEDSGILRDADNHIVAEVYNVRDVRLVAAAPELLTACKSALVEMCNTVAPRNSFTDAADLLDAVVSRAEGTL